MTKSERSAYILDYLNHLYPNPLTPLRHQDPYTLLIAVLLSAQCTDKRVNQISPKLFELACTPEQMIFFSPKHIEEIIRPCGLGQQKSKAIHCLSKLLLEKYDGMVPDDLDALKSLPGVGHKTASVVMAQAFGHAMFPVDTHIHRLAQRWGLSTGRNVTQTERDLKNIFPKECWNRLHLQIIFYGREHCPARKCFGLSCPLCRNLFPKRKKAVLKK